tara:strand:+ start:188 stop:607 length:420 start_codon:yes stop_codon:yes gene_type:complete
MKKGFYKKKDIALLFIRLTVGGILFLNHGLEKLINYKEMLEWFPDPFLIGNIPGFVFAFIADVIGSLLLVLGFKTKIASCLILANLLFALVFVHHFNILEIHGELIVCYLVSLGLLWISGNGKISLDQYFFKPTDSSVQ